MNWFNKKKTSDKRFLVRNEYRDFRQDYFETNDIDEAILSVRCSKRTREIFDRYTRICIRDHKINEYKIQLENYNKQKKEKEND